MELLICVRAGDDALYPRSSQGLLQFLLLHSVDIFMDIEFE